jgi:hypothetical protein
VKMFARVLRPRRELGDFPLHRTTARVGPLGQSTAGESGRRDTATQSHLNASHPLGGACRQPSPERFPPNASLLLWLCANCERRWVALGQVAVGLGPKTYLGSVVPWAPTASVD